MDYSYIPISDAQLLLSVVLVIICGLISWLLQLGLLKSLLWGTVRAFVQLTVIGYALTYIFKINNLYLILLVILLMSLVASREASRRIKKGDKTVIMSFIALSASTFVVGIIVVRLVISPHPWYSAQVMIPIFGMLLGNSMNAIALSLDRMYAEVHSHVNQVEQLLCLGATPWEAARDYLRRAVEAGMLPTINSLMIVGLVSLPGMMTGQILAGMDPREAVRYQFVVMIMIAAAVAIACLCMAGLSFRKMFTSDMGVAETLRHN
ncbi:MAG TPA: iron export ABC transporter permease subunit FetB [Syntrophomonadaceae bacterium]|nr:iron export ABC transporter permease subunit FetB [Syntrophomonadaceae bacterium]